MEELLAAVNQFRDDRDWRQFHNPKDLSLSLSLEASELLENFQWKTSEEAIATTLPNIKEELADVFIYGMMLATDLDVDLSEIILDKLAKNAEKYPIEASKGYKEKYDKI